MNTLELFDEKNDNTVDINKQEIMDNLESNEKNSAGRWRQDEHQRFIEAIVKYGNDWRKVEKHVITRSSTQARSHAQKFFMKIKRTNLFEENSDNNSIKILYKKVGEMDESEHQNAILKLSRISFDRKNSSASGKTSRKESCASSSYLKSPCFKTTPPTSISFPEKLSLTTENFKEFKTDTVSLKENEKVTQVEPDFRENLNVTINGNKSDEK